MTCTTFTLPTINKSHVTLAASVPKNCEKWNADYWIACDYWDTHAHEWLAQFRASILRCSNLTKYMLTPGQQLVHARICANDAKNANDAKTCANDAQKIDALLIVPVPSVRWGHYHDRQWYMVVIELYISLTMKAIKQMGGTRKKKKNTTFQKLPISTRNKPTTQGSWIWWSTTWAIPSQR